ncbi:MAG: TldD/PmbA family protein [Candidatus Micrarchaeota archaeon]|nr:TldD/PmbA family protein [Candidatus Micrarchaeota archaeon]
MNYDHEILLKEISQEIDSIRKALLTKDYFIDLRFSAYTKVEVSVINKEKKINRSNCLEVGLRIMNGNKKHFYYFENSLTEVKPILHKVKSMFTKKGKIARDYEELASKETYENYEKYENIEPQEAIELIKTSKERSAEKYDINIKSFICSYSEITAIKGVLNSLGCDIRYSYSESYLRCRAIAQKNDVQEVGTQTHGSREGSKKLEFENTIENAVHTVKELLEAKECKRGKYSVIIDNRMAGVLAHELLGHASEGDSIINRDSVLRKYYNKAMADEKITIVDDNEIGFGKLKYDDEGIKAQKVEIIKKGVLSNYLNSVETAQKLKQKPTGNTRCQNPLFMPIVRMRTTYFKPWKTKKEDLFDEKECVYFIDMTGGSVNPVTGNFVFKPKKAYLIKNGEKQQILKNVILSGNIIETIKNIQDIGDDFQLSHGYCGKLGQYVPVGDGGPHMKLEKILIG